MYYIPLYVQIFFLHLFEFLMMMHDSMVDSRARTTLSLLPWLNFNVHGKEIQGILLGFSTANKQI